ncbi:MAG: hypothetical protein SGJ19_20405 [Planctomycetia bacterium]|nr:hypothetical protein [Planctomycetia bacterium]
MTSEDLLLPCPGVLIVYQRGPGGVPTRVVARVELKRHRAGQLFANVEVDDGLDTWVSDDDEIGQRRLFDGREPIVTRRSGDGPKPAA